MLLVEGIEDSQVPDPQRGELSGLLERNGQVSCPCSWHLLGLFGIEDPIFRVRDHRPERVDRRGRESYIATQSTRMR
jgi:hypothetical protein